MIDVNTLAQLIDAYFDGDAGGEPTAKELATFIVSRNYERLCGSDHVDPGLLLLGAFTVIDKAFERCKEKHITISQDGKHTQLVELPSGQLLYGNSPSHVLLQYARSLAKSPQ
jgi:hypothetical protein